MWLWHSERKPWTRQATENLLYQVYVQRNTLPPDGRSVAECHAQLRATMEPFILQHIEEAIRVYQSSNNQYSCAELRQMMSFPIEDYHDDIYYGIIIALLQLENRTIESQIRIIARSYFERSAKDDKEVAKKYVKPQKSTISTYHRGQVTVEVVLSECGQRMILNSSLR